LNVKQLLEEDEYFAMIRGSSSPLRHFEPVRIKPN